jgi:ketosteroid isomerase-like protein
VIDARTVGGHVEGRMDRDRFAAWLEGYRRAWEAQDADAIRALFTEDAAYRTSPFREPYRGHEAIVRLWLEERPDAPGTFTARYEPLAVEGDVAVAQGWTRYRDAQTGAEGEVYANIFVTRFAADGRCAAFTEHYMKRGKRDGEPILD